ncbi:MAG TPA: hypothetical protein VKV73_06165 [Chloroflexota bacterium]|nr:hypothetical protein [Chloroflexota bacterium]
MATVLRHHSLVGYLALANGFSWLMLFVLGRWLGLPAQLVVLAFTLGPTTAAAIVTAAVDGRSGLRDLQRRSVLWRVEWRWYAVTLLGIPLVILGGDTPHAGRLGELRPDVTNPLAGVLSRPRTTAGRSADCRRPSAARRSRGRRWRVSKGSR